MRILAAVLCGFMAFTQSVFASDFTAKVSVYPIENFQIGSEETQFGKLAYVGGFAMTSENRNFGALSSIRMLDDTGTRFAAITDTGFFLSGVIVRDSGLKPVDIAALKFQELPDMNDQLSNNKWETDSEALVVDGPIAIIGFERKHRLSAYHFDGTSLGKRINNLDFLISGNELRSNRGFETLARAPVNSPLGGSLVVVSEKSIDAKGNILAAILEGSKKGIFTIARSDEFDITDGDFLPNGDLILLERSFGMARGIRMRLRLIAADLLKAGALVEGEILLEANMASQIDNMEGLDIWQAPDGSTRFSLVSDDNKSMLQRNLYLEFILSR